MYNEKIFAAESGYWRTRKESDLKREIRNEKSPFRRDTLQYMYELFKREGVYDEQRKNKSNKE